MKRFAILAALTSTIAGAQALTDEWYCSCNIYHVGYIGLADQCKEAGREVVAVQNSYTGVWYDMCKMDLATYPIETSPVDAGAWTLDACKEAYADQYADLVGDFFARCTRNPDN
ncbi:hypothetical protein NpNSSI1_00005117 [Neofusicoccum parvum]|nr:hypothetical protein NpNSSI1_00005117 [Neofusicoccum parvum]